MKKEANKHKGKKDKKKEQPISTEQRLLDLSSTWEYSEGAANNLPTDMTEILKPQKDIAQEVEVEEEVKATTPPFPRSDTPVGGVSKFSVSTLSKMFDNVQKPQQEIGEGEKWSSKIDSNSAKSSPKRKPVAAPRAVSPLPVTSPSARQAVAYYFDFNQLEATAIDNVPAGDVSSLKDHTHITNRHEVLYDYQAVDSSEVSITEGQVVTVGPQDELSEDWVMVQLVGGAKGWVPKAYLQPLVGPEGVGRVEDTPQAAGMGGTGGLQVQAEEQGNHIQPNAVSSLCELNTPVSCSLYSTHTLPYSLRHSPTHANHNLDYCIHIYE